MSVRNLVQTALILLPVVGGLWNLLRRRSGGMGLMLLLGGTLFLVIGAGLLFGRSYPPARSLHRIDGRLAYVETYEALLFEEQLEPIPIPEGAQARLEQGTVTTAASKNKYGTVPARTYTLYSVLLGPPGPWQEIYTSDNLDAAQARLDELKDFMRGAAPRMVLSGDPGGGTNAAEVMLGLVPYLLGLGVIALASMVGPTTETPLQQRPKRGGSRGGRKGKRRG